MTPQEYAHTQIALAAALQTLRGLDLQGFIVACDRAEALGPMIDPTLYRNAHAGLDRIRVIAMAGKELVQVAAGLSDLDILAMALGASQALAAAESKKADDHA
jgi:hypothetical protein